MITANLMMAAMDLSVRDEGRKITPLCFKKRMPFPLCRSDFRSSESFVEFR